MTDNEESAWRASRLATTTLLELQELVAEGDTPAAEWMKVHLTGLDFWACQIARLVMMSDDLSIGLIATLDAITPNFVRLLIADCALRDIDRPQRARVAELWKATITAYQAGDMPPHLTTEQGNS